MWKKLFIIIKKVFTGNDPVIVSQSKLLWDKQYKEGKWDFLLHRPDNTAYIAERISDILQDKKISILDIGCGNGGLLSLFEAEKKDFSYTGVDISGQAIARLKERFPKYRFVEVDIEKDTFCAGEKFDVIVLSEILYYVDYLKLLRRCKSYTKKDTLVFVSVYKSWRSFFLWRGIKKFISVKYMTTLQNKKKVSWSVMEGYFL